jgi:hypothetical protein
VPQRAASLHAGHFRPQQLIIHGGLAQLFSQAGDLTISSIAWLLFHRLPAACQEGVPPRREASGRDLQRSRQQVYLFSAQELQYHLSLLLGGKSHGFRFVARCFISSRSTRSLR